ncbi:hypothetical protein DACRYDRAFT_23869 [Dacryopinax primogenitus]|uniref:Cupin type-1 domain-containing protein n=1 Tax=Dacryopinax primogenitus (strain DJM 731) TaxID=1858805 RepID=M5FUS8_DACPD|nr:uncharacterized protein DACRYDRAFT_23869 [Dacryopinax primogenitus]EJT99259.1 hypothetical protein DACRYDRAFT_23869 [Dacryopinax primogenitus]
MGMKRIVTGHASTCTPGKEPVVKILINGEPSYTSHANTVQIAQVWQTHGTPTHVQGEKDETEGANPNAIVVQDGSNMRWGELQPGAFVAMHRTSSVDYNIMTHGTIALVTPKEELDPSDIPTDLNDPRLEHTLASQGDVIIQRGTLHGWLNKGDVPAAWVSVILPADSYKTAEGETVKDGFWAKRSA